MAPHPGPFVTRRGGASSRSRSRSTRRMTASSIRPCAAQLDDRVPLGVEQLAAQAAGSRASAPRLAAVAVGVEARAKALLAEPVRAAQRARRCPPAPSPPRSAPRGARAPPRRRGCAPSPPPFARARRPRARARGSRRGSVRPCRTSVARITQNVRNTIRSRSGNAPPASVVSGSASAAASETAPRIPDHPISAVARQAGIGVALAGAAAEQARQVGGGEDPHDAREDHAPLTSAPSPSSVAVE